MTRPATGIGTMSRLFGLMVLGLVWAGGAPRATATVTQPFVGITYVERAETSPRAIRMHVVQIDLTAPGLRFKLSSPAGAREVVRQSTLEYLKAEHAQVAINGHFFLPWPSTTPEAEIIGLGASEGRVYSIFESPAQSYALVANAPAINIDAGNHATLVHRDPAIADGAHVLEGVVLWNTVAGSSAAATPIE